MDNPSVIHIREVVQVTIKNIVVINGKEVEIKDLPDAELFAEKLNRKALTARNYEKIGDDMKPDMEKIIQVLISLIEEQEHVKIEYTLEKRTEEKTA